ncbi:MAG: 50S ribosomal protein L5 [Planctomycetaceae bacterium]|nr:50S ribosomal protein L5 [Planctomycetaceae bacterium]|tara:strand:- start:94 stop:642 length:549 start_codon:yes stop_codon:yes gene_type:complete
MKPRLQEKFENEILSTMAESRVGQNILALPRLEKIVVNMGVGKAIDDKKYLEMAVSALTEITGQKPIITRARQSIAGFKLREGQAIGAKVTLRRKRMYEFLDRLISIALPRVRDFRGIKRTAFDGNGNYSLGLNEQTVFPELNPDKYLLPQGMNISFVTSAKTNQDALELLEKFGMPFQAAS